MHAHSRKLLCDFIVQIAQQPNRSWRAGAVRPRLGSAAVRRLHDDHLSVDRITGNQHGAI